MTSSTNAGSAHEDRGRNVVTVEVLGGRRHADQSCSVEVRVELELVEDADHREPLITEPYELSPRDVVDAEPLRSNGTEHGGRVGARDVVEEHTVGHGPRQSVEQIGIDRLNRDAARLAARNEISLEHLGIDIADGRGLFDRPDAGDHRRRFLRQLTASQTDAAARLNGEEVGAELVELRQEIGLGRL